MTKKKKTAVLLTAVYPERRLNIRTTVRFRLIIHHLVLMMTFKQALVANCLHSPHDSLPWNKNELLTKPSAEVKTFKQAVNELIKWMKYWNILVLLDIWILI